MGMVEGKVAVITGAGRGIGRGEALLLARDGCRVLVNTLGTDFDGGGLDSRLAAQVADKIQAAGAVAHVEDISEPFGAESAIGLALDI